MRLGGAGTGTGAEAGNWGRREAVHLGVQPEQRRWGIRPAVSQHDRGGSGEAQTPRDRHPAYAASGAGYDGAARNRFGTNAQRAHSRHQATRRHTRRAEPGLARRGEEGVAEGWEWGLGPAPESEEWEQLGAEAVRVRNWIRRWGEVCDMDGDCTAPLWVG
ncbi:hypothetical protein B0H14DRAFT_427996 [Mycena olivaceomarginata]|nr:hypothetical protein B0H14DRAFT_427996 [Mycena olivaceomarginata]